MTKSICAAALLCFHSAASFVSAAVLKAKGYPYRYFFAEAAGHTDGRVNRHPLPGTLEWPGQAYPIE